MRNILFVDDETNVLDGLRRSLRSMRKQWDMEFVDSGSQALNMMQGKAYDVVVSDIRMPGMNGVELLQQVKKLYPETIRLALSGYAESQLELECARAAHQFLAKPISVDLLQTAIDRSVNLQDLLSNTDLRSTAGSLDSLPSIPKVYQEILEETANLEGSIGRVGEIIGKDVAMTAKILQLVNSAFFGLTRQVNSTKQAASLLGLDTIKSLVFSQEIFSEFDDTKGSGLDLEALVDHSTTVAVVAKKLALMEGLSEKESDQAFMAGTVHNVGKLVLGKEFPLRYKNVTDGISTESLTFRAAEAEEFGVSHDMIGGYLLGIWGLPDPIVEAVAFHHSPSDASPSGFCVLSCVYLAVCMIHAVENELDDAEVMDYLDLGYLSRATDLSKIGQWQAIAASQLADH